MPSFQFEGNTPHWRHPLNSLIICPGITLIAFFSTCVSTRSSLGVLLLLTALAAFSISSFDDF